MRIWKLKQPPIAQVAHLNELEQYVGKELGLTEWMTIEQDRINTFAEVTEDLQWIHTDPEKSAAFSPYKKTVAHGFLVLSLASKISYDALSIGDVVMGVNYGLDKVRFTNATRSGAKLRGRLALWLLTPSRGELNTK